MVPSKFNQILGEMNDFLTSGEKAAFRTIEIYRSLDSEKIKINTGYPARTKHNLIDILLLLLLYLLFCITIGRAP